MCTVISPLHMLISSTRWNNVSFPRTRTTNKHKTPRHAVFINTIARSDIDFYALFLDWCFLWFIFYNIFRRKLYIYVIYQVSWCLMPQHGSCPMSYDVGISMLIHYDTTWSAPAVSAAPAVMARVERRCWAFVRVATAVVDCRSINTPYANTGNA